MNSTITPKANNRIYKGVPIIRELLKSNYSLAIYLQGWRQENYFPMCVTITSVQFFLLVSILFSAFYPTFKNIDEAVIFFLQFGVIGIVTLGYFRKIISGVIKHWSIPTRVTKEGPGDNFVILSVSLSVVLMFIFSCSLIFIGYKYFIL